MATSAPPSGAAVTLGSCANYSVTGDTTATLATLSKTCVVGVCPGNVLTYGTAPSRVGTAICSGGDTYLKVFNATTTNVTSSTTLLTSTDSDVQKAAGYTGVGGCDAGVYTVPAGTYRVRFVGGCHSTAACSGRIGYQINGTATCPRTPAAAAGRRLLGW